MFTIALFELRSRLRLVSTWIYFGVYALLSCLWFAAISGAIPNVKIVLGSEKILVNSPYSLAFALTSVGFLGTMTIAALMGQSIQQDFEHGCFHFFFSAPISKRSYFFGRFIGAYLTLIVIFSGMALGILIGAHLPGTDPARVGPFSIEAFLRPYLFGALPNILWLGGLFFVMAALTRQMAPVYITGVVVLIGYLVAVNLLQDFENTTLAALIDPVGLTSLDVLTRYWSVAEKNASQIPFSGLLLLNRVIWLGFGIVITAAGYWLFRMKAGEEKASRRSRKQDAQAALAGPKQSSAAPLTARPNHTNAAYFRMLPGLVRLYLRETVKRPGFLAIVLAGLLFTISAATIGSTFGTKTYPVTYKVLELTAGQFSIFVLVITAIYAGELVWRERDARMDEIVDSSPAPTWLLFFGKLLTLFAIQVLLLLIVLFCSIGIQLAEHYTKLELSHYVFDLFVLRLARYWTIAALALTIHVLVNQKYLGHFLVVLIFVLTLQLPRLGLEDRLYLYGSTPDILYSDINGYGHFLAAACWFYLYWGAVAILFLVAANWLWIRGKENAWRERIRLVGKRKTAASIGVAAFAVSVFVLDGGWIYYNTHILNHFQSAQSNRARQAEYEKRYKPLAGKPQPRITAVELNVDLYPREHRAQLQGDLTLMNKTDHEIRDLYVHLPPTAKIDRFDSDRSGKMADEAPELFWHHYVLDQALTPGATMLFRYKIEYAARGFRNNGADPVVLDNGTFLNSGVTPWSYLVPSFGYNEEIELQSDADRKKFGLAPKERMHDLDDPIWRQTSGLSRDADWIDYTATISTEPDQLAVTSGYLEKEWSENGRHYFRYRMDAKIANSYTIQSGKYAVKRDRWDNGNHSVAIEIDYQPGHEFDLDRMIAGVKDSLTYFTTHFGPYQHKILRIIEFPRYERFAESLPNTVPYSEAVGFIAKVDDNNPKDIDYPYFVTAHEVAHQWWAHQEVPANVQGGEFITESLAEYSALMVLKHKYGDAKMRRFLKYELDRYLVGRGSENKKEQPLMREDGATYVHYQKGSLALYAFQDAIGEDAISQALAAFDKKWAFQGPPYATSRDLLAEFRKVTPADKQYLISDLFEKIILWDDRATRATYHQVASDKFEVDLTVFAKKMQADSLGTETEVPMDDWVDIGVFDATETPLYLQKHRIRSGETSIKLVVNKIPAKAGIDPLNKLIDRNPDDNVVPVEKK